jgi:hypothetical protein
MSYVWVLLCGCQGETKTKTKTKTKQKMIFFQGKGNVKCKERIVEEEKGRERSQEGIISEFIISVHGDFLEREKKLRVF